MVLFKVCSDRVLLKVLSDGILYRVLIDKVLFRVLSDRVLLKVLNDRIRFRVLSDRVLLKVLTDRVLFWSAVTGSLWGSFLGTSVIGSSLSSSVAGSSSGSSASGSSLESCLGSSVIASSLWSLVIWSSLMSSIRRTSLESWDVCSVLSRLFLVCQTMYDFSFAFQVYLWFEFSNNAGAFFPLKEVLQTPLHGITAFTFFIVFLISCWNDLFIRIFFLSIARLSLVHTYFYLLMMMTCWWWSWICLLSILKAREIICKIRKISKQLNILRPEPELKTEADTGAVLRNF